MSGSSLLIDNPDLYKQQCISKKETVSEICQAQAQLKLSVRLQLDKTGQLCQLYKNVQKIEQNKKAPKQENQKSYFL